MASPVQLESQEQPSRRRGQRFRVQAPLDVTVLRSGIPDTVPGRSVTVGEGGIAAVLAGELLPGEAVGVEIKLPQAAETLRARALVRHHDRLRSGLEFIGLSTQQQKVIRTWAGESKAEAEAGVRPKVAVNEGRANEIEVKEVEVNETRVKIGGPGGTVPPPVMKRRGRTCDIFSGGRAALLLAGLWWEVGSRVGEIWNRTCRRM